MLDLAREAMGDDADSNPMPPGLEPAAAEGKFGLEYFNAQLSFGVVEPGPAPADPRGRQERKVAAAPLRRPASRVDVRYYSDFFVPKLPTRRSRCTWERSDRVPPGLHHLRGRPSGGMTFWFPLEAYGPDAGTMSFVNGSHRHGVRATTRPTATRRLDVFPELR